MNERAEEKRARYVVSQSLGVEVVRNDFGTNDKQVDALIRLPEGDAALEIFSVHDDAFASQWNALERYGHDLVVPVLDHAWSARLTHTANVKRVREQLPELLAVLEAVLLMKRRRQPLPDEFKKLGITDLFPVDHRPRGHVSLHSEGWTSGPSSAGGLGEWAVMQLDTARDVVEKLSAHPAEQKHAFIWTTIGTEFGVQDKLEAREGQRLPTMAPRLPEGVTHLWVVGSQTSQGGVAWFPDRGWWRAWDLPLDGNLGSG